MAKTAKTAATKTTTTTKAAKPAAPKKAAAKKAAGSSSTGLKAPLTPSPALAEVVGKQPLPRTEIIKKIWDYIKAKGLQDTQNKRMINADDKLKELFEGKKQISMFDLAKVVSKHVK
ncbi:DNA topoisomerase III [Chitinophaga agrisoli]|uniref:DNA topoisomerase III n=1 Tax=Chitinophaga agrisoli TaxID=2607653 RepID=A0A5B2VRQ9_9BACT|nr:SWIB/MDM2 domain-containing protein [Chitinophaga agrisoli]KAA2240887.1 DNA topoisomerase III [Chitinophaga agrisoli]